MPSNTAKQSLRLGRWLLLLLSVVPLALVLLYMANFRLSVPYGDEWRIDTPIAISAVDGSWTVARLFTVDDGHRTVFTNAFIAFIAVASHWTLQVETAVSFLLIIGQIILLLLLFRQSPRDRSLWPVTLFLLSALIFTLLRITSWWSFRHSHYNFAAFFFLLALWISGRWPGGPWRSFIAILICSVCASFSIALGLLVWPLMGVILVARRFRRAQLAVWIVTAVVVGVLYFSNSGIGLGEELQIDPSMAIQVSKSTAIRFSISGAMLNNLVALFAGPILGENQSVSVYGAAVIAAVLLGVVNLWRIVRSDGGWKNVWNWLAVTGYGIGGALLIGAGRFDGHSLAPSFFEQYVSVATWLWIGFVILALMSLSRTLPARRRGSVLLAVTNGVALGVVVGLFQLQSYNTIPSIEEYWGRKFRFAVDTSIKPEEQCVLDYRFTRDNSCLDQLQLRRGEYESIDIFAAYRLTIFARQQPIRVLPDSYQPDDAVVISTRSPWENAHIRDWLLDGVPDDQLYNVLPNRRIDVARSLNTPRPLVNIAALPGAILPPGKATIWLIYPAAEESETAGDLLKQLQEGGYTRFATSTLPAPINLMVNGYRRSEDGH